MGAEYPVLRYPGNITGSDNAQPGSMLGWDEVGRPYEVIDAEWIFSEGSQSKTDCATCRGSGIAPDHSPQPDDEQPCPECVGYTNVYLQYATPETLRAFAEKNGGLPAAMVATAAGLR